MITHLDQVTEYPLCWPSTKDRTTKRQERSTFTTSLAKAHREIQQELPRWGVRHYTVSMAPAYRTGPTDPAVAVWFNIPGPTKDAPPATYHRFDASGIRADAAVLGWTSDAQRGATYDANDWCPKCSAERP